MESSSFSCKEFLARSVSSSSGSDSDSDGRTGSRKRRSRSPGSDSDVSDIFEVSEPRDRFDGILNDCLKLRRTDVGSTSSIDNLEIQQLNLEDLHELPVIDDTMLDCLPTAGSSVVEQPVVAMPAENDGASSVPEPETVRPSNKHLSKKERNKIAQKRCRKNKQIREQKREEELKRLQQQVSTLQKEKNQMQSQLEHFREMFSKQSMSSMLMSSLCVICAVICVFTPCAVPSTDSQLGTQHFASPTGRSLLSVTASPPPPPPHDMNKMVETQFADSMSAAELLLSCLSTADQTAL